ncbi:hypothetical protein BGZ60DRAFT_398745 [Tricladium varicosporioides]|nr:hypothetical protein BGZ60DRAFT_398745 [Hymenoscyphus varicosporioides]
MPEHDAAIILSSLVLNDSDQSSTNRVVWKTLRSFTCFQDLPREIRTLIWTLCFPPPRRIDLAPGKLCRKKHNKKSKNKEINPHYHPLEDTWRTRLPTLRINRESRTETLLHYRPIHRSNKYDYSTSQSVTIDLPILFFRPNYDILTLAQDDFHSYAYWWAHNLAKLNPGGFNGVKILRVQEIMATQFPYEIPPPSEGTSRLLALFPDLEELEVERAGYPIFSIEGEEFSDTPEEAYVKVFGPRDNGFESYVEAMVEEGVIEKAPKIKYIFDV